MVRLDFGSRREIMIIVDANKCRDLDMIDMDVWLQAEKIHNDIEHIYSIYTYKYVQWS